MWAPTVVLAPPKRLPVAAPSRHLTMAQFTMAPIMAPPAIAPPIMYPVMAPIMYPVSMAPTAARKRQQYTFVNMADQVVEQKKRKLLQPDQIRKTKAKCTVLNSVQTGHGAVLVVDDASAHTILAQQPVPWPVHQPAPTEKSSAESSTLEVGTTPSFAESFRTPPPCPPTPEKNDTTMMAVPTSGGWRSLSKGEQAAQALLTLPYYTSVWRLSTSWGVL